MSVTLVTGDRVTVPRAETSGELSVRPAAGRAGMAFATTTRDGHQHVVPADAAQLVATGRLDRRLFDVTTLIDAGYDDACSSTLSLIVTGTGGGSLALPGTVITANLSGVDGFVVQVAKPSAAALWDALTDGTGTRTLAAGVDKVWLDSGQRATWRAACAASAGTS